MTQLGFPLWTAPAATDPARFDREADRNASDPTPAMLALPHALILQHRETVAVLATSALFLASVLMLLSMIG